jgi:hypothetical protein
MTEDGQPTPAEPAITDAPSIVSKDGSLVENWHTLAPEGYEDLKESKTLPRIKNIWDFGKSYEHVRRQVPMDKIAKPTEHFTDQDWEEWHNAGGRPPTPQDYNIQKPEDFPDELWNQDNANSAQDLFHRIGLNQNQVNELLNWNNQLTLDAKKVMDEATAQKVQEVEDKLHKDWGAAYDQKIQMGNMAIEKDPDTKDPEYKERLLDKVNRDPDLIRFASNLGAKFIEAGAPMPNIPTPDEINSRISQEMQKKSYTDRNHPDHKNQVKVVERLFKERAENMKTGFQK